MVTERLRRIFEYIHPYPSLFITCRSLPVNSSGMGSCHRARHARLRQTLCCRHETTHADPCARADSTARADAAPGTTRVFLPCEIPDRHQTDVRYVTFCLSY